MAYMFHVFKNSIIVLSLFSLLLWMSLRIFFTPFLWKYYINGISTSIIYVLSSSLTASLTAVATFTNLTYVYCTILSGPYFCSVVTEKLLEPNFNITYSLSTGVKTATDVFGSVIELGNPENLPLHQSEILELALVIQHSSSLEGKEVLAAQMMKLSHLTRDVKDQVIDLNSRGHNAFFFISFQFSRLQTMIENNNHSKHNIEKISATLDLLFDNLTTEFSQLLERIEDSLPIAARAADLGLRISGMLLQERSKLVETQEKAPLWRKLLDHGSWGAKQLSRDLDLTSQSIRGLKNVNMKLEDLRSVLIAYQKNVGFFKASLNSIHLADHQFSVEDEVFALQTVIESFNQAVKQSKANGKDQVNKIDS